MTPPLWQKVRRTKKPLDESERGERNSWLKTQHSKNEDQGIWVITSWQIHGRKVETVRFHFRAPKSLWMVTAATELKDTCSLEEKLRPT